MVNRELIEYVHGSLSDGVSLEEIRIELLGSGWSGDEVRDAIHYVRKHYNLHNSPHIEHHSGKHSKKLVWPIAILVIILIVGVSLFFVFSQEKTTKIDIKLLNIDIKTPKSSYAMGEEFLGENVLDYSGELFEAVVLQKYSRKGLSKEYYAKSRGFLGGSSSLGLLRLTAFKLNTDGNYGASTDYFYEEGEYVFTISVYACSDIEKALVIDCSEAEAKHIDENVEPIKTVEKIIVVSGGVNPSECKTKDDCTQYCEGCEEGTQICEQVKEICMDCFIDSQCKDSYTCENNICESEEIETCIPEHHKGCYQGNVYWIDSCYEREDLIEECPEGLCEDGGCVSEEIKTIDCGNSLLTIETVGNVPEFDCFIEASETCNPAKLLHTLTMEIFVLSTSTTYMELQGIESDKCVYYQRLESNSVEFTDAMVQQMLDSGLTQEEIDQQEQTANDSAQELIGSERTCKFEQEDLTGMLNRWSQGSISTEDWDVAICEGDYV